MPMFSPTFTALLREAQFTKEMLGTGSTQIRFANFARKGIYFQAFTSLSTGLERIGKLCLMLDHFVTTGGSFPEFQDLRRQIGHNLELLYRRSQDIVNARAIRLSLSKDLSDPIHQAILSVLNDFAEGDRYSNINALVGGPLSDPIASWRNKVDVRLYASRVTKKKKEQIEADARSATAMMGVIANVRHTSETGDDVSDLETATRLTGEWEAVAPYRQLCVLQIIRYWAELLGELEGCARGVSPENIPYFGELFAAFCNDDSLLRSRKTWDNV